MYGIDNMKVVVAAVGDAISVASKVIHGNVLALFNLAGPLLSLRNVDFTALKNEVTDLTPDERVLVETEFKNHLQLVDATIQAKVLAGVGYLEDAIVLVGEGVQVGQDAVAFYLKMKQFLGA